VTLDLATMSLDDVASAINTAAAGAGSTQGPGAHLMIRHRRLQRSFADGLIAEEVGDLWEPWMRHVDEVLEDDTLLELVQQELSKRIQKSPNRGRPGTTAEVVLRMLLLKHMRGWSCEVLTREVRSNLVYREFTRIGGGTVPDDKSMGRLARQLGPERIGHDGAAGATGDAADAGEDLRRHCRLRRQDCQPVRTDDRNHPQRKSRQAERIRQAG
jgi:hypothetical protein